MRRYADTQDLMSVIVLCPSCQYAATFHRTPITICTRCQQPYPDSVRLPAERALATSVARKPGLLVLAQFFTAVGAVAFIGLLLSAPFDAGTFTINGEVVSGPEFLRRAGPAFLLVALLFGATAIGLWRDRPWTRPLMMAYWPVVTALVIGLSWGQPELVTQALGALSFSIPAAVVAWWYLYRKDNVVAYFRARERSPDITRGAA